MNGKVNTQMNIRSIVDCVSVHKDCISVCKLCNSSELIILNLWVVNIINIGKIVFLTGYDTTGNIQIVIKDKNLLERIKEIKIGYLLEIKGFLNNNPKKDKIEIILNDFKLINKSKNLPFSFFFDEIIVGEETLFKYRYLDLRKRNNIELLKIKSKFYNFIYNFFFEKGFLNIETPILSQHSPEGARCFLTLSNKNNHYYTLPQSPQIFKQILMIGGIGKYFQIAKCFRNETARSNRQIEFSQLDVEKSFTSVKELQNLLTDFLINSINTIFDKNIKISFSSFTYEESMRVFGTDKPDLRKNEDELKFVWITDWPLFIWDEKKSKYINNRSPFTNIKEEYIQPFLDNKIDLKEIISDSFDLVCNGEEIVSGSTRINSPDLQRKVLEINNDNNKNIKYLDYFIEALEYGTPPHGGFGLGIDRLLSVILKIKNLKQLIAFPKSIDGYCPLTKTPDLLNPNDIYNKKN